MHRRDFMSRTGAAAAALGFFPASLAGLEREPRPGRLERRSLGRTGAKLSLLGFGGIVVRDATPAEADRRVGEAIDRGVDYFDVAPSYGDAEQKLGPALAPYRKDVFLACKTLEREAAGARRELEQSLKRLRTDHLDLYQLHAVTKRADVETILAPGGALETFLAARAAGQVRFLGFSAHSVEAALALMDGFDFDTILFPVNFATWHAGSFGPQVLEKARSKGMGVLALKAMARGPRPDGPRTEFPKCWYAPLAEPEEARMGLRFTLSHPVTAAIPPGDETLFGMALDLATDFEPLSQAEALAIKERAQAEEPLFAYPSADA